MRIAIIRYHTLQYVMNTTHRTANQTPVNHPLPRKAAATSNQRTQKERGVPAASRDVTRS